ncbi:MAG: ATP-binding protein [Elusimicrobia bacterium]|nr:ATP-binding protein [Candidatus Obscuribacterium magneticum]
MFERNLAPTLRAAWDDAPIVLLQGARRTGKTSLAKKITGKENPARYLTLEDDATLSAATNDPDRFAAGLDGPVIIDEVQRAPHIFSSIRAAVDRKRRPGRFFLLSDANLNVWPKLPDSLAGRMETYTLWPLSQGEVLGVNEGFVDSLLAEAFPLPSEIRENSLSLLDRIFWGGYPDVLKQEVAHRRTTWFRTTLSTVLRHDVQEWLPGEDGSSLSSLLTLLATYSTSLLNFSELARVVKIPEDTLKQYLTLLEWTYLVHLLPAWTGSHPGQRIIKTPKLYFCDTGVMASLMAREVKEWTSDNLPLWPLLETFVFAELTKQISWTRARPRLHHFRTRSGMEVDFILEFREGEIVGLDVKATTTLGTADFRGLKELEEAAGPHFHRGIVLYLGSRVVPFGPHIHALPVSALWTLGAKQPEERSTPLPDLEKVI